MQDVCSLIRRQGLRFQCYLDPRREAVLDAEHSVRLNWETYLFCDQWERERFLADPVLYCGLLTDPVSRSRFRPQANAPRVVDEGVAYYFATPAHAAHFQADPKRYRTPMWKMPGVESTSHP